MLVALARLFIEEGAYVFITGRRPKELDEAVRELGDNATGSVAGSKGTPAFGVYGATKAAVRSFVRTWTAELKERHIRANVVSPGPIETELATRMPADKIEELFPPCRWGE